MIIYWVWENIMMIQNLWHSEKYTILGTENSCCFKKPCEPGKTGKSKNSTALKLQSNNPRYRMESIFFAYSKATVE